MFPLLYITVCVCTLDHYHERSLKDANALVSTMNFTKYSSTIFLFLVNSMFPLLKREGLALPYSAVMVLFTMVSWPTVRAELDALPNSKLAYASVRVRAIASVGTPSKLLHSLKRF